MSEEVWKWIPGYKRYYKVSNLGRVKSVTRMIKTSNNQVRIYSGHIMNLNTNRIGYKTVSLWKRNKWKSFKVHQLVLMAFIGPAPTKHICRHFPDRDPANNNLNNLQWGTIQQNQGPDRVAHGTSNRGERCGASKLTENEVLEIKYHLKTRSKLVDVINLAKRYNISRTSIYDIKMKRTWKHIP